MKDKNQGKQASTSAKVMAALLAGLMIFSVVAGVIIYFVS